VPFARPRCTPRAICNGKRYSYYCCVHSLRRDGKCTARRVKAAELETAISDELPALVGEVELTENELIPGRDYGEDMARGRPDLASVTGGRWGAVSGRGVRADQETLKRAHHELARLAALEPVEARMEPTRTGHTFGQKWESLDAQGRNEFLRAAAG
jgi:hypothetical protein